MRELIEQLEKEMERVPGLEESILALHETGSCSAAPPIFGALTRLGIYRDKERERLAYRYLMNHIDKEVPS